MTNSFREFLLTEQRAYLGEKVGDILTAAQELNSDSKHMGSRDLNRFAERLADRIRTILKTQWPRENTKHLLALQKVGVALMKAIEDKGDLHGTVAGAVAALEKLSGQLGTPLHKLGPTTPKAEPKESPKAVSQPERPAPPPAAQQPPAPPAMPPSDNPSLGGNAGPLQGF